ncbi:MULTISPECIES: hypothetical protein [unclassified Haloarcula]|nr:MULTISPECIES: hypothetical protein [unclassified Haloarcula]
MAHADPSSALATDTAPPDTTQRRLPHVVGDRTHEVAIERRAVLKE